jgi:hypothetical protein
MANRAVLAFWYNLQRKWSVSVRDRPARRGHQQTFLESRSRQLTAHSATQVPIGRGWAEFGNARLGRNGLSMLHQ